MNHPSFEDLVMITSWTKPTDVNIVERSQPGSRRRLPTRAARSLHMRPHVSTEPVHLMLTTAHDILLVHMNSILRTFCADLKFSAQNYSRHVPSIIVGEPRATTITFLFQTTTSRDVPLTGWHRPTRSLRRPESTALAIRPT